MAKRSWKTTSKGLGYIPSFSNSTCSYLYSAGQKNEEYTVIHTGVSSKQSVP